MPFVNLNPPALVTAREISLFTVEFARFVLVKPERIRFLFVFSSGKVMAKWKNSDAISSGYTRYEN